jgi:hypothetical protein
MEFLVGHPRWTNTDCDETTNAYCDCDETTNAYASSYTRPIRFRFACS